MSMQSYSLEITQTLQRIVIVEADSLENAVLAIQAQLKDETIVLDHNDYRDTEINLYQEH
jgi:hypothetical protein